MDNNPLISIVMCFLNEERFLKEAIESVLQQEYANWELFLIDDGSTDESTNIARWYSQQYPSKIFYGHHEHHANKGLAASRNYALKKSAGELVAFLDGDDVWLPNFLSEIVGVFEKQSVSMVCEATEYWYSWDDSIQEDVIVPIGTMQDKQYTPAQLMLNLYPLGKGAAPCVCGIIVKKDALYKHRGFEEAFKGMYEDQTFLTKFYLNEKVYISSKCNNRYRQNRGSLVSASHETGMYIHERKRFLNWLEQYFKHNHVSDRKLKKLLFKAQMPYRHPLLHFTFYRFPQLVKYYFQNLLKVA